MIQKPINLWLVLKRGLRRRCPHCGEGSIFERWATLKECCESCGLALAARQADAWAFMYVSTALVTGLILAGMFFVEPQHLWLARIILLMTAILALLGSLPYRKGLAIALDYWMELFWGKSDSSN